MRARRFAPKPRPAERHSANRNRLLRISPVRCLDSQVTQRAISTNASYAQAPSTRIGPLEGAGARLHPDLRQARRQARHRARFGLKGQEKITLKRLLKDMADEGLIDGKKTAFHRMGGVPKVTVLRVVEIDEGEAIAVPDSWEPDSGAAPPRIRLIEAKKGKTRQAAAQGRRPCADADRGKRRQLDRAIR